VNKKWCRVYLSVDKPICIYTYEFKYCNGLDMCLLLFILFVMGEKLLVSKRGF